MHDPLCPLFGVLDERWNWQCNCDFIRDIRADESEQAAQRVATAMDNYCQCRGDVCSCDYSGMGAVAVAAARGVKDPK